MMIDGMREDFLSGPQVTANFGYEGYKATYIEDMLRDFPDHTRYYSVQCDIPTLTFQRMLQDLTGRNPKLNSMMGNLRSMGSDLEYDSLF